VQNAHLVMYATKLIAPLIVRLPYTVVAVDGCFCRSISKLIPDRPHGRSVVALHVPRLQDRREERAARVIDQGHELRKSSLRLGHGVELFIDY
jgi:hypothetical protein